MYINMSVKKIIVNIDFFSWIIKQSQIRETAFLNP